MGEQLICTQSMGVRFLSLPPQPKKRGRPATGLTTATLTVRLPKDIVATIKRRAKQNGRSVNDYLQGVFLMQFHSRPSRTSRRDRKTPQKDWELYTGNCAEHTPSC